MKRLCTLLALAGLACSSGSQSDMTDAERGEIRSAVERQVQVIAEGASQMDADLQISVMAPDVTFVDFTTHYSGTGAIREGWTELFSAFETFEFEWTEIGVQVLSRDWALAEAQGTVQRRFVDGRFQETNPYLFMKAVFHLIDVDWKLTRGHVSGSVRTVDDLP